MVKSATESGPPETAAKIADNSLSPAAIESFYFDDAIC